MSCRRWLMRCLSLIAFTVPAALAAAGEPEASAGPPAEFASLWPADQTRTWLGPEYWANRLQDWQVADGRLECVTSGGDRNVHLLTRQLGPAKGSLEMSVRLGAVGDPKRLTAGWAGFRLGIRGPFDDYRDSVRRASGLRAGVTTDGQLFIGNPKPASAALVDRGLPRAKWRVHYVDSQETQGEDSRAESVFDGRADTVWHTRWREKKAPYPHEIQIDLGGEHEVCGFAVLPRQSISVGRINDYDFYVSTDAKTWGTPVATGRFPDSADLQTVRFKAKTGRYVRLVARSGILDRPACAVAELYVFDPTSADPGDEARAAPAAALPMDDLVLRLSAKPAGNAYEVVLSAVDAKGGELLAETAQRVAADGLIGNLALVCDASGQGGGQAVRGNVRFWFRHWRVDGSKVEVHPERAFGPILWAQHTLSRGVLKLTAQMPPLGPRDTQTVRLEIQRTKDGPWASIGEAPIDPAARTATFRNEPWDASRDTPYRVAYALRDVDGKTRDHYWPGTIRHDPVEKETVVVAAFTGNADYGFPNNDVVAHVLAHDPDLLFFSGDNIYENVGGYGCQRSPLDAAVLDYLRKWYFYGWAFRDLMRDRPCVSIPDDHDVYQGNLWGAGGRKTDRDNKGGYVMPAEWVRMVERTQTSHLPDPYDPAPIAQAIGVYYTGLWYGRISFAILEDRKFKSGPAGLVPATTSGRPDHVANGIFDPKTADVPGAEMLGPRQLKFLRHWAADWQDADMKCVLSQTVFAGAATHHGGGLARLVADYDSNGWPQTGRNMALRELRRGFAFHIAGDQHLATIIHHGTDDWGDAVWSMAVPSVANFYLRAWRPVEPGKNRGDGIPTYTGDFLDPFGNRITVWAATNPGDSMGVEPKAIHDKKPGYGIVRFDKTRQTITMECWPRFSDPKDPKAVQYAGWPKTIHMRENYGRKPAAWLPTIKVAGLKNPVVQVKEEPSGQLVYALRVRGTEFRPWVFAPGTYTVVVGEPGAGKMQTVTVESLPKDGAKTVELTF